MLPNEEGEIWHNAVYNDISSNNIENLDKFINKWPHNFEELDEVLAKAYGELKLKNVRLENETEIFIENKLINLHFFSNTSRHEQIISDVDGQLIITKALQVIDQYLKSTLEFSKLLNNIRERIELTVESIRLLKTDYSNTEKVDGKFIFLAKFIAKNIHVLKQQLNSTHDRLPWEQMEFCLVIFIASYTKRQEMNLYYRATLNKRKILSHIENFAVELEAQTGELLSSKHDPEVRKIINGYPGFEELYKDNQQIREVQSLVKISEHINSKVLKCNPKKKDGQLIIAKALNLIGEYLESTWEFSKLFFNTTTSEQKNTSKIIVELRNSLSLLATAPPERIGTEENRDLNVLEDVKKVGDVITGILNELNTNATEIFVKNKLISLRSFFVTDGKDPSLKVDDDKNTLIQLILQNISLLRGKYSNMEEVDENFIFTTKSIEQNISKIKRKLKLTNDRLPWEEMEFCLGSFVNSYTKKQEMNPFYRGLLNKFRILNHLENFAKKLEDENTENEQVVTKKSIPEFEDLYKDYQQIRDVHSLKKISDHINLALFSNPNDKDGQLIITRVLQVIGEHLKNTPDSPKLSDTRSELLLLSLQNTATKIIRELRDKLSHDDNDSLSKRIEIEKKLDDNFFLNVKNDMKKFGDVITDILYNNQMETIRILLKKIADSKNSDEIKEVAELLTTVQIDEIMVSNNFKMLEHEKLEELVNELSDNISDKTDLEKDIFSQIANEFKCAESRSENLRSAYLNGVTRLKRLSDSLALINLDNKRVKLIKLLANDALVNINLKIEPRRWKKLSDLSMNIYNIAWSKPRSNHNKITKLIFEIFYIAEFGTGNIKWIEKFREKLNEKVSCTPAKEDGSKQDKIDSVPEEKNNQFALKRSELKRILNENSLSGSPTEKLSFYKSDRKIQALVEMLVLDIMTILDSSKNSYLENNLLFLDDNAPLLNGKCLRNHLAHDNALFDVLLSDPSMAVILNAKKLTEENIILCKKKIGKFITDDPLKLRKKYNQGLHVTTNQDRMFVALEEGNLETVKDCIQNGADVNARSINSLTTLHFAAKGPSLEVVQFIQSILSSLYIFKDFDGQSPLHIAAAYGSTSIVEFFIKNFHLNVDHINTRCETPLHIAAQNGHKDTVEVLLKSNANTVIIDLRGRSPVHYAIRNNHTEVAKILLRKDENIHNNTIGNYSPLHIAVHCGNLDLVNFLLENNAQVNAKTDKDTTPLHLAANGHREVVKALIAKGADVNATDLNNYIPLHYAIEHGHGEIATILLEHTDNVNAFDIMNGNSFLHCASSYGFLGIVTSLLQNGAEANFANFKSQTPLHCAALAGHLEICNALLKYGVKIIDARDKNNYTPLHYAAEQGRTEVAELLIENEADLNAKASDGRTPLFIAALHGQKDIIDLLLREKADVNAEATDGETPLHAAATNGNKDVLDILIQCKDKVNAKMINGATPLHIAAQLGHRDATDLLVINNAEVNVRANNDLTPLDVAVMGGNKDVVNLLIKYNAQVNEMGIPQSTPLYIASEAGYTEIVEILAKKGANVNVTINTGTPLSSAIRYNHKETIEILLKYSANVTIDALSEAVCTGHTDIVKILLESECTIINMPVNIENVTLLHLAADENHKEIVKVLITKRADPNAITVFNETPLYFAARKGYEDVVEILIAGGANVNFQSLNFNHYTPLHVAASMGHSAVVKVLLDKNQADINVTDMNGITPLVFAVVTGNLQVVKILLQEPLLDREAKDTNGDSLLHIASNKSSLLHIVEYLVDEGFDINARNAYGAKPIHIAAREGHKDTVDFFLKTKGFNINDPDETNMTLLRYAAWKGHLEVVNYLIVHGADVNAKDDNGLTTLHIAVKFGHKEVIKVLLKNGAIYNAVVHLNTKPLGMTNDQEVIRLLKLINKLFLAVKRNNTSEVENCIKDGAFVNAKNIENVTPLHYAAWKGYEGVVNILLQNRTNPNVVGNNGLTPLHYAAKFSHLKIVKALLSNYAIYNPLSDGGKTPSDFTKDERITNLFNLVDDSFNSIKTGDPQIVEKLNKLEDQDTIKAIMNARNRENETLVVVAMHNNFSELEQLKAISQGDISAKIKEALELFNKGNYKKALFTFNEAFIKRKSILGSDNPGTLDIQTYIAQVLFAKGDYQKALNTYEEIFQKQKAILGFGSKDTLTIRHSIAVVLHRLGKCEEAFNIHQEVYQKQEELLGSTHLDTLVTQLYIVLVLRMQGKYEEALNIVRTVFEKRNEILSGATLSTAALSQSNIEVLKNYKDYILETEKVTLGIDSFEIAEEHCRLKKYPEALKTYKKVLNIQKCVLGPNHRETLNVQYNIANLLFIQGKWTDASKAYTEALDPIKDVYGRYHPTVMDILEKLKILNLRSARTVK